ncbi:hypothetical protein C5167_040594 [Papaver somniferum]|uniref:Uncharacterized protein n=1 Tax=Papaver somniferum TaxID=3469 RepID=A0A4Y7IJM1_PAPSO|nr:hypothetical protein C5167_040594 [Papaver somniferum]
MAKSIVENHNQKGSGGELKTRNHSSTTELPQVAVVGSQNSGTSTVLEAQDEGLMEAQQGIEEITGELGISFIRVTDGAKMVFIRIKLQAKVP